LQSCRRFPFSVILACPESFFEKEEGFPTSGNDNEKEIYLSDTLQSCRMVHVCVIPHLMRNPEILFIIWIPAFAGMTVYF